MNDYATYSPEDNKLRLYVGRVPRDEYEKLRAEGWTSTPKQACDFVAVWTPERLQTALDYSDGVLLDEDQGPAERAADRAERFAGYRDKRANEAHGHADRYEAGPQAYGFQSQARADRAAAKVDRLAGYACDAWSKAEYWQRRTAGVISHALHLSAPGVRMGRIKTIEADLRRVMNGHTREQITSPRALLWVNHLELRLAYENQMLEAQGGRAAHVEMEPGGFLGTMQIHKVNRSTATGRVVSVSVRVPKVERWTYKTQNVPGTDYALSQIDTERLPAHAYRPPTDEERAEFAARVKQQKADRPQKAPCPLINPTDEEAERLQAIWNEANPRPGEEPATVARMTQATYSANSGGSYSAVETEEITGGGFRRRGAGSMSFVDFPSVAKVRRHGRRVIVITDKPQKKFPADVWSDPRPAVLAEVISRAEELRAAARKDWFSNLTEEETRLFDQARRVGLAYLNSLSQFGLTAKGEETLSTPAPAPAAPAAVGTATLAQALFGF